MNKNKKGHHLNSKALACLRNSSQKSGGFAELFEDNAGLQKKSVFDDTSDDVTDYDEEYRRCSKEPDNRQSAPFNELFDEETGLQTKSVFDDHIDDDTDYAEEYQNSFVIENEGIEQTANTPYENDSNMTIPVLHKPGRLVDSVQMAMKGGVADVSSESPPSVPSSSGAMDNRAAVVNFDIAQTSPIIKSDRKKNLSLDIAMDFVQKHNLVLSGKTLWRYDGQIYIPLIESDAQRLIFSEYRDAVCSGNTMSLIKNIVSLLRVTVIDAVEMFPANEHIIVFRNGTLEVTTDHFRNNSPKDLATSSLSIDYDPDQTEMPTVCRFLNTITNGDGVLYKRLLQVIGYILSNDLRAKSFFYLEGVGNAGKSRFCDLIASFFSVNGANKVARITLQDLGNKFSMANLVNTKLNISEDLPDKPLSEVTVSKIKMISDANCLEAEAKFVQPFSFRPQCKLLFASNHPLKLKERDDAFANRVVYIPFRYSIPKGKQDKHILEKMQNELPALFNHAYRAYKQLVESGYSRAGINTIKPEILITNFSTAEEKEYAMKQFVELHCEVSQDSIVSVSEIQNKYNEFCRENQYIPITGARFSREIFKYLPDTTERDKIGNQKRGFKGIRLK